MKKRKIITVKWLRKQWGCRREVARHEKMYGERLRITEKNILSLADNNFSLFWLGYEIFTEQAYTKLKKAEHILWIKCYSEQFKKIKYKHELAKLWYKIWEEME